MFSHIGGVSRTFARVECNEPDLGMEYLQATMNLVAERNAANERVRQHNREVEARNREVFLRNGMDPDADEEDQETFEILYRDACNGGGRELACLAEAFLSGEYGAVEDKPKAVRLFKKAAQKGCVDAEARLAYCYFNGEGVPESESEGRRWLEKAARHGDSDSQKVLAEIKEVEEKERRAERKRRLCDRGLRFSATDSQMNNFASLLDDANSCGDSAHAAEYKLGMGFYKGTDGQEKSLERALGWLKKAASGKHADAMFQVGYMYYFGEHVREDEPEAFRWFKAAAEKGSADGMCRLGECYFNGRGCEKDIELGRQWYVKAAEKGVGLAQYNAGLIYYYGKGVPVDYKVAFRWLKAAESRDDAKVVLGECYEYGRGTVEDKAKAGKLYQAAADANRVLGWYNLARCLEDGLCGIGQSLSKAFTYYKKAADAKNSASRFRLGNCYRNGWGVEKDLKAALEWYRKAADGGVVDAQFRVGFAYYFGEGTDEDEQEAFKWFEKSAKNGNADGMCRLGECYLHGRGCEKDLKSAREWYMKAAEQGNALAQMNVGTIYHDGIGVDQDYGESVKWFRKAADQGRADAMRMMGQCYDKGEGVSACVDEAIVWYDEAGSEDDEIAQKRFREIALALTEQVKSGDALAQNRLGMVYHLGAGIMQDYEVAMQWFKIARANGNVTAMANIGRCYLYGKGVAEDEELAAEWFKIAVKKGSVSAQQELSSCYAHGWGVDEDDEVAAEWKRIAAGNTQGVL